MGAERDRVDTFGKLEDGLLQASDWYHWGPYLSERQWGTVREDYSADGEAWDHFPHDHARSRAYRWGEDGMAGFSDVQQRLCLSLALWNGSDPILKERMFGLTGNQGNHGEDVKEYWWFTDALPSHALNRWRYHYPQGAFPYDDLVAENGRRDKHQPEYELLDTGVFDGDRFWVVEVEYTKDGPHDILMTVQVTNAGPDTETLHVLPTVWFRNTWSWGDDEPAPRLRAAAGSSIDIDHPLFGDLELVAGPGPDGVEPTLLFCENDTNTARLFGTDDGPAHPKDGINDHVLHGSPTVNPDREGTKASAWYRVEVASQQTVELRLRLRARGGPADAVGRSFDQVTALRRAEADEFYAELTPEGTTADEALVMRQAFAGMLWSKQLYSYDVARWLDGDPGQPVPPSSRKTGRNSRWRSFDAFDVMSMPDTWEYPWFAAWDLAFHCVALAHVDPAFAKYQLILICREWFQHPSGALPAYEWSFDDLNPPVQAWAALEVFAVDGSTDLDFLRRVFDKLLVNFTWWINREDADGSNLFEGGFLGLDNIGPIDRDKLPVAGRLRAVRRDRVDGPVLAAHGDHGVRAAPQGQPADAGPHHQVPRALRADQERARRPGALGRDRRVLLRPHRARLRRAHPGEGAVDGRRAARARRPRDRRTADRADRRARQGVRRAAGRPGEPDPRGTVPCAAHPGTAGCSSASSAWTASNDSSRGCSTRVSSSRRTACAPSRRHTATTRTSSTSAS